MNDNIPKVPKILPSLNLVLTGTFFCLGISLVVSILHMRMSFLDVRMEIPGNGIFQVFYDRGEGFNEKDSRYFQLDHSVFDRRILLPSEIKALRIDPVNSDETVRFRKLLFKPSGQIRGVNLVKADGFRTHAIDTFHQETQQAGLLIPFEGTTDPYLVFPMSVWDGEADSDHSGGMNWGSLVLATSQGTVVLLLGLFLVRMAFVWMAYLLPKLLLPLRQFYETERFGWMRQLNVLSCMAIAMIAVVISLISQCSLLHHYTVSFDLTSPDSDHIGVFFDQGYGFNNGDLVYWKTNGSDRKQTHVAQLKTVRELKRIRIDPGNHSGSFLLENVRIRKAFGRWHRLDLRDWSVRNGIQIVTQNAGQLEISSEFGDPYVFSGSLTMDTGSSPVTMGRIVSLFAIFLSVTFVLVVYNVLRTFRFSKGVTQIVSE